MKNYQGKEEMINGKWFPVNVKAESIKDANRKIFIGQVKSYGVVQRLRGRFSEVK